ncbi:NAD(P)/FAD-dependent oxidoreductase [uncultured Aquimarina sp.]|uniref:NAD(P)/FAD-dependent oxidoreductase n=1 Tax=uncultured Aquimarina sp. TaxID=575652 RepID=UPI00262F2C17|nr:NAD(P)/FAD-dependent oxidoreductase [uncultured Aquimarina sp.]
MNNDTITYDVIIIGAGVAGCATAISLKNEAPHLNIAIIERASELKTEDPTSYRIGETLPPHASQQLQNLGIWKSFLKCNFINAYGTSAAWGSSELYHNEYIYSPYGYGWHLDRIVFDQFMIKETKKKGVFTYFETSVISSEKTSNYWHLQINTKKRQTAIKSSFVIDATGKKAAFSCLQKTFKIKEDQMVGIYRFYDISNQNENKFRLGNGTCVESDPYGWWYSATLPNKTLVIGYMTDTDIANEMQLKKTTVFNELLYNSCYTYSRTLKTKKLSEPRVVAAHTQYLSSVVGNSWLAVGDAASSYDPISSLGIFKSLAMSQFAAYATLDDLKGNRSGLHKYQQIITNDYLGYQKKRQEYYNQESRFTSSPFWKRRHTNINYN